jgi:hypothetical protein
MMSANRIAALGQGGLVRKSKKTRVQLKSPGHERLFWKALLQYLIASWKQAIF